MRHLLARAGIFGSAFFLLVAQVAPTQARCNEVPPWGNRCLSPSFKMSLHKDEKALENRKKYEEEVNKLFVEVLEENKHRIEALIKKYGMEEELE